MHLNDSPRDGMLKLFKLVDMTCKEPFTCALFTCALVHWHLAHLFIIIKHRCNRLLRDSSALIAKYNDFPRMPSNEDISYFTRTGSQRERKSKPPGLSRFLLSYAADKGHPKFSLGSAIKKTKPYTCSESWVNNDLGYWPKKIPVENFSAMKPFSKLTFFSSISVKKK